VAAAVISAAEMVLKSYGGVDKGKKMWYNLQWKPESSIVGDFLSPPIDNSILVVDKGPQWQNRLAELSGSGLVMPLWAFVVYVA